MGPAFWMTCIAAALLVYAISQTMPEATFSTVCGVTVALAICGYKDIRRKK